MVKLRNSWSPARRGWLAGLDLILKACINLQYFYIPSPSSTTNSSQLPDFVVKSSDLDQTINEERLKRKE
jgi:hypothetical protein